MSTKSSVVNQSVGENVAKSHTDLPHWKRIQR